MDATTSSKVCCACSGSSKLMEITSPLARFTSMRRCRLLVLPVSFTKAMCAALMTTLWTSAALPRSRLTVRIVSAPDTGLTLQGAVVVTAWGQVLLLAGEQRDGICHYAPRVGGGSDRVDGPLLA